MHDSEHDEETSLDEFDLRHYDPQIGRWTTTDPYEQFANPYLGMGNSPVNNVDPDGGEGTNWVSYITKAGKKVAQWFDEANDQASAEQVVSDLGGTDAFDMGLTGFWTSTENGIQNWLLKSNGKAELLGFKLFDALKVLDQLKEIAPSKSGFWQSFNFFSKAANNLGGQMLFGVINDAYITQQNYAQGHTGFIQDLNGDLISYRERLTAGMNTFQLLMSPSDFALFGTTNVAKTGSLGAGRTGVEQWLQNAGNLEKGQIIQNIEEVGFKKVFDGKGMMHFERGGMKIRLDPPQLPKTPYNHMHLNYGGKYGFL